jgi:septation ring formation regulator EzrA
VQLHGGCVRRSKQNSVSASISLRMTIRVALALGRSFSKAIVVLSLLITPLLISTAQDRIQQPLASDADNNDRPLSTLEEEMRAKRAIKEADRQYQENLERARDLSNLGASIVASFKQKRQLDERDFKKIEKVEKLAKRIRNAAGGSEDEFEMDKPPRDLNSAVEMFDCVSQSLKAQVEKTPKHVISATVIDEANVLLELVRILRTLPPKV